LERLFHQKPGQTNHIKQQKLDLCGFTTICKVSGKFVPVPPKERNRAKTSSENSHQMEKTDADR
jgi:hypothetical protein